MELEVPRGTAYTAAATLFVVVLTLLGWTVTPVNAAGDPLRLFRWAIDHCCRHRGGLRRGDVITTGTFTGIHFLAGPARVEAEFPGIGTVEIRFSA